MHAFQKAMRSLPVLLAALLALSGCTIPSGDDLLAAPKPSKNYQTLQAELEKILTTKIYSAPVSGENRSTIQLVDIDSDGTEEAISFFRESANSNEFTVYVHKKKDDAYVLTGSVTGTGTAIQSVDYPVISPDGRRGMVIAWKLTGDGLGAVTMCDFDASGAPSVLLETEYSAMELTDLTGNGAKDLLLIGTDPTGKRVARLYQYANGELNLVGEAATSQEAVTILRMSSGRVKGSLPAVFAEEKTESGIGLTTDVFVYADGTLHNLALDGEDSTSRGTYRPISVYAADCNGDGEIELPRAVLMAGYTDAASSDAIFMVDWYSYGVEGQPERVKTTYNNVSEEWSFVIDDAWHDQITATKSSDTGLSAVHFYQYLGADQRLPLFSIYCATGTLSDYYASRGDLIQLAETGRAVYFARLDEGASKSSIAIDADGVRARFSLVTQDWNN